MSDVIQLSAELDDQLEQSEAGDRAAAYVDPRTIPTRFSLLKHMALSAAHYREACQRQDDDSLAARFAALSHAKDRTDALRFGSALHWMLLGGAGEVAKWTGARRSGKAWEEFKHRAVEEGCREILTAREHGLATGISEAIRCHPLAMRLLFDGTIVERRIDWEWLGKPVRLTPDAWTPNHVVDLKTAVTAKPDRFIWQGLRYHYHAQLWLYGEAIRAATGHQPGEAYVIAVEKTRPHAVTILRLTEHVLDIGARLCRLWMEALLECERSNEWPGYAESPVAFDLPESGEAFEVEIDGRLVAV